MTKFPLLLLALGLACGGGCRPNAGESVPAPPPVVPIPQLCAVTGVVVSVDVAARSLEVKHEAIPGYMAAMTMPFEVRDPRELDGLAPGTAIVFRMLVTETDAWIDQVRRTGRVLTQPPTRGHFRVAREVEPLQVGDRLPDYHFTNELGVAVSTGEFSGQAVVLAFLFTRCPYPTMCPLTASKLRDLQTKLAETPGAPTNWHVLAVTIDPDFDTPARLKAFAEAYRYDPRHWSFVTGEPMDVTALAEQFGQAVWHEGELPSHNLRTVIVNPAGKVHRILPGNDWSVAQLMAELVAAAGRP